MPFPRGLRSLNHAEYRRYFVAHFVAQIGSWMQSVAQAWLVLQLTDSPFRLGLIGTLQFGPVLLFSVVSGAVADRFAKRRILVATQAVLAVQAAGLGALAWTDRAEYWHVVALAVVLGFANVIEMPARQSYVADLVGRDDLINAVALNSASFNAARIVGPAVAGVMIAKLGVVPAFFANGIGHVVVVVSLLSLTSRGQPARRSVAGVLRDVAAGLRYAFSTPRIRLLLGLLFVVSFCVFNFSVYVPLLAKTVLGLGAEGFGYLMAALGVGAVGGALTVGASSGREASVRTLFLQATLACGGLTAMFAVRHAAVAAVMLIAIGYFGTMLVAACNTALQLASPDELRGRVMSLYVLIWGGSFPVGSFIVGAISEAASVSVAFAAMGGAGLAMLLGLAAWWRAETGGRGAPPRRRGAPSVGGYGGRSEPPIR